MRQRARVWLMFGESWEADGKDKDDCPDNYEITWGREFRYDAARARYLNRELDPVELQTYGYTVSLSDTWSDYNGDVIYGDWSVEAGSPPTVTQLHNYQPGLGENGTPGSSTGLRYAHSDPLGTLRSHTDASCAASASFAYTAFGERVDGGAFQRHSYAGAWGYQAGDFPSGNPAAFLHVGMRWYDPAIGRFLQRDPIGIQGGLNAYAYVDSRPTIDVDPLGLYGLDDLIIDITGGPSYDPWWPWLADFFDDKTRVDHASNFLPVLALDFPVSTSFRLRHRMRLPEQ
ncbi:MAG: RHS repeat-associated core domain-containing protein [Planctomycetia bacterium]|nr:RHS repeat-associated core domain-containing protein [Planctomycetia bacterium]